MLDRRTVLYVALGVIIFALWDAWQKDYGDHVAPHKQEVTTHQEVQGSKKEPKNTPKDTPIAAVYESAPESRLIKVRTDVLDVAIDLIGGNVVRAELLQYPEVLNQKKSVQLLSNSEKRYYVANSSLLGEGGPDVSNKPARYHSSRLRYTLEPKQNELQIKLMWNGTNGLRVAKIFTFKRDKYDIAVKYEINNQTKHAWSGKFLATIKRKEFDNATGLFQFNTYTGAALSSPETPYEQLSFKDITEATQKRRENIRTSQGGWVAMQQRYFLSVWIPNQEDTYDYFCRAHDGVYTIGLSDNALKVSTGDKATIGATLYLGPDITENLAHFARGLDRTVDYKWLWHIAVLFFWVLKKIYQLVGNWGWAIILMTILIKLLFYKLSESSCRSMGKMRELMPKIQALKERYGDDKQKLHQATMELYKREKINPLNLGGCLPMIIQIPFFLALYYVLIGAVELRHAPFIFWIHDLSARDPFFILPILMGLSMLLQQKLTPSSADPAQAKMMMFMPVIFTVFFFNFPAGLVLYWLVSNLLSILQQWYINKNLEHVKKS